jgi:hypothetical protein
VATPEPAPAPVPPPPPPPTFGSYLAKAQLYADSLAQVTPEPVTMPALKQNKKEKDAAFKARKKEWQATLDSLSALSKQNAAAKKDSLSLKRQAALLEAFDFLLTPGGGTDEAKIDTLYFYAQSASSQDQPLFVLSRKALQDRIAASHASKASVDSAHAAAQAVANAAATDKTAGLWPLRVTLLALTAVCTGGAVWQGLNASRSKDDYKTLNAKLKSQPSPQTFDEVELYTLNYGSLERHKSDTENAELMRNGFIVGAGVFGAGSIISFFF